MMSISRNQMFSREHAGIAGEPWVEFQSSKFSVFQARVCATGICELQLMRQRTQSKTA